MSICPDTAARPPAVFPSALFPVRQGIARHSASRSGSAGHRGACTWAAHTRSTFSRSPRSRRAARRSSAQSRRLPRPITSSMAARVNLRWFKWRWSMSATGSGNFNGRIIRRRRMARDNPGREEKRAHRRRPGETDFCGQKESLITHDSQPKLETSATGVPPFEKGGRGELCTSFGRILQPHVHRSLQSRGDFLRSSHGDFLRS